MLKLYHLKSATLLFSLRNKLNLNDLNPNLIQALLAVRAF